MKDKKELEVTLTSEELAAVENLRKVNENLEGFKEKYKKLVEETGFAWVVDVNSPLNNIQLGIGKVNN